MSDLVQGDQSKYWFLIFHHNIEGGFFTPKNVLSSHTKHKFSVLGRLNDQYKYEDSFHFLLTYPQTSGYINWTQNENPIHRTTNSTYHVISNTFQSVNQFEGLSLHGGNDATFLEGQIGEKTTWFYAIGQYRGSRDYPNSLAGPRWILDNKNSTEVNLYLRIYDTSLAHQLYSFTVFYKRRYNIQIHVLFICFFLD